MDLFTFMAVAVLSMATSAVVCWVLRPATSKPLPLGSTRRLTSDDLAAINATMHRSYDKNTEYWIEHLGILVQHVVVEPTLGEGEITLDIVNPLGYGFDAAQVIGIRYFGAAEQHFLEEMIVGPKSRWIVPKGSHLDVGCFRCSDEEAFVPIDLGVISRISSMLLTLGHARSEGPVRPLFHIALVMIPADIEVALGAPGTVIETGVEARSMDQILGYAKAG